MIANCPQCAMTMNFDDERLPPDPFTVLCPRCRQNVTIMPPSKEEPQLAAPQQPARPEAIDATDSDPLRMLSEMLTGVMKQQQAQESQVQKWNRRRVLLCIDDGTLRDKIRASLEPMRYEVFSADYAAEAIEILQETRAEVIVLNPTFDTENQGAGAMMNHVGALTPQIRRRTYVVLLSPQLRTLDTYLALANGVNLTVHVDDAGSFQAIFERSVRDFNELYRPLHQATSAAPF